MSNWFYNDDPMTDGRTPFELLDKDYIKQTSINHTVIDLQRYLNEHGWTMNEYSGEAAVRFKGKTA